MEDEGYKMEDIRNRVIDLQVSAARQEAMAVASERHFEDHKVQNEKDFTHIDECIHTSRVTSTKSLDLMHSELAVVKADINALKQFMWKISGGLAVATTVLTYLANKYI